LTASLSSTSAIFLRATTESSTKKTFMASPSTICSIWPTSDSPKVLAMICSTSRMETRRPSSSSVTAEDIAPGAGGEGLRGANLFPIHADDAIDFVHQEAQVALAVLGHQHRSAESGRGVLELHGTVASEITGITLPRRLISPSTPSGMFGVRVMSGCVADFAHLEHIDAEQFMGAQRKQQDFHPVGTGKAGARIDAVEHRRRRHGKSCRDAVGPRHVCRVGRLA
jgi:hypothetical protein